MKTTQSRVGTSDSLDEPKVAETPDGEKPQQPLMMWIPVAGLQEIERLLVCALNPRVEYVDDHAKMTGDALHQTRQDVARALDELRAYVYTRRV